MRYISMKNMAMSVSRNGSLVKNVLMVCDSCLAMSPILIFCMPLSWSGWGRMKQCHSQRAMNRPVTP